MKLAFFWICLLNAIPIFGQSGFHIQPFTGVRFTDNKLPDFNTTDKKEPISLFKLGARLTKNQWPIFVEASGAYFVEPFFDYTWIHTAVAQKRIVLCYDIGFNNKKSDFGGGYFKSRIESLANFTSSGFIRKYYGASLFYRRHSGPISVELRSLLIFKPYFAGLVPWNGNYAVDCLYNFGSKAKGIENQQTTYRALWVSATIGARFFRNKSKSIVLDGEVTPKIGISPAFGFDLFYKNWPISLSVDKDIWVVINGGSTVRDFKGFIANTGFGLKWHQKLKNERHLRFGLNYLITRDMELRELKPLPVSKIYQIHGIGTSVSYEIFPRAELEFRNNFPFDGRKPFEARLMTLGLFYRLKT